MITAFPCGSKKCSVTFAAFSIAESRSTPCPVPKYDPSIVHTITYGFTPF